MIRTLFEIRRASGTRQGVVQYLLRHKSLTGAFSSAERALFLSSQRPSEPTNLINCQKVSGTIPQ